MVKDCFHVELLLSMFGLVISIHPFNLFSSDSVCFHVELLLSTFGVNSFYSLIQSLFKWLCSHAELLVSMIGINSFYSMIQSIFKLLCLFEGLNQEINMTVIHNSMYSHLTQG